MIKLISRQVTYLSILGFVCAALLTPFVTYAAVAKPSCTLTAATSIGKVELKNKDTVSLREGDVINIAWKSKHAKKAFTSNKSKIDLSGSATSSPAKTTKQIYHFENGSKKTLCEVTIRIVKGNLNEFFLSSKSTKPTLKGKASGTKSVQIQIYKQGSEDVLYTSKLIDVKNGNWSSKITKKLAQGEYDVVLLGEKKFLLNSIATGTLDIGKKATPKSEMTTNPKSSTTFVAEAILLLTGGTVKAGATVSVSYLQIINIGKTFGNVEAIVIKQNGSASVNSIAALSISNEWGLLTRIDNPVFKNEYTSIPIELLIGAQEMRLLTVKAVLVPNIASHVGKQLKLDVSSIDTNARVQNVFPIRGTTWTIGY